MSVTSAPPGSDSEGYVRHVARPHLLRAHQSKHGRTLVIAHRGASLARPENTIAAFEEARRLGADMVELDVRRAPDGRLVVQHDSVAGVVGPDVPTLDDAIDACLPMAINIEVKNDATEPDWDPSRSVAADVATLVGRRSLHDAVLVSSFDMGSVDRVRVVDARVATALLTVRAEGAVDACIRHGHSAVHPLYTVVTPAFVDEAHGAGLAVHVWTVDDADTMRELAARGVDGICTDDPALAVRVLGSQPGQTTRNASG